MPQERDVFDRLSCCFDFGSLTPRSVIHSGYRVESGGEFDDGQQFDDDKLFDLIARRKAGSTIITDCKHAFEDRAQRGRLTNLADA